MPGTKKIFYMYIIDNVVIQTDFDNVKVFLFTN